MLGLGCGVVSWIDQFRTPRWRPYRAAMFVGLGASGVVPMLHGLQMYGFKDMNERMSLALVVLQGLIYMFGAFLYAVCSFPSLIPVQFHTHPLSIPTPCSCRLHSDGPRPAGPRERSPGSSTSGVAPTRSSTFASSSPPAPTSTVWRAPSTTTTPSWAPSVPETSGCCNIFFS